MTTPDTRICDDDDDDSLYEEPHVVTSIPSPPVKPLNLVATHTDVRELDSVLDREDEEHDNDDAEQHEVHKYDINEFEDVEPFAPIGKLSKVEILPQVQSPQPPNTHTPPYHSPKLRTIDAPDISPLLRISQDPVPRNVPSPHLAPLSEQTTNILDDEDDDWFDEDEKKVDVESLHSTPVSSPMPSPKLPKLSEPSINHSTLNHDDPNFFVPTVSSLETPKKSANSASNFGGISLLTRASQTFYKAFRKRKSEPVVKTPKTPPSKQSSEPINVNLETKYAKLHELLEAQIASLRTARTGFVDINLMKPMLESTLKAVQTDGEAIHSDFSQLERRVETLHGQAQESKRESEEDIILKEKLLVGSKMKLAEASAELEMLQYNLRAVKKMIADPKRKRQRELDEARRNASVCREARVAVEQRLENRRKALSRERSQLVKLEKGYRDIEGDW